jgi:HEAT repeat protein
MRYDIIAFVLITVIAVVCLLQSLYLYNKKQKMLKTIIDLYTANSALEDMIATQALGNTEPIEQSDGFVKFLSESREWAFNYIEDVQKQISDFRSSVSPELKKIKSGKKLEKIEMEIMLNNISTAFQKLDNVLPKEDTTNKEK